MAMNPYYNQCPPQPPYYGQMWPGQGGYYGPAMYMPGAYAPPYGPGFGGYAYGGGLPTDEDMLNMIYDAIDSDPLIPFDADISVDVDAGEVKLSGSVNSKRVKHAAGEDAWFIPGVVDVHNNIKVMRKERQGRRGRAA